MKKNIGALDRTIRVVLGLVVIAAGMYLKNWWGALGLLPLLTAVVGWCPAYTPFGISTCAEEKKPAAATRG